MVNLNCGELGNTRTRAGLEKRFACVPFYLLEAMVVKGLAEISKDRSKEKAVRGQARTTSNPTKPL